MTSCKEIRVQNEPCRQGKDCIYESTQTPEKNIRMKGEIKAEWKKSKCCLYSAASSPPNKAILNHI